MITVLTVIRTKKLIDRINENHGFITMKDAAACLGSNYTIASRYIASLREAGMEIRTDARLYRVHDKIRQYVEEHDGVVNYQDAADAIGCHPATVKKHVAYLRAEGMDIQLLVRWKKRKDGKNEAAR